jgi:hypothetical protein
MLQHSLDWDDLPEPVRGYFEALQIGPGERIYLRKIAKLTDCDLATAAGQHDWLRTEQQTVVQALAARFSRGRRTIRRRLKSLPPALRTANAGIHGASGNQGQA